MSSNNPFKRGFTGNLSFSRIVVIDYGSEFPSAYRSLHPSQSSLTDHAITQCHCFFDDDQVLVLLEDRADRPEGFNQDGIVKSVIYQVVSSDANFLRHGGDFHSSEEAEQVIQALHFENGFYSRSWEISSSHLSKESYDYLTNYKAVNEIPFEIFKLPFGTVGLKLIGTPWADDEIYNLETTRQDMKNHGMPDQAIDLLCMASAADVRFLIFDPDASELEGLPKYDW